MLGRYKISKISEGAYQFFLKAGNGETILTSEIYKSRHSAENGIKSVQKNSILDCRFDRRETNDNKFYFNLKAANHQVIGSSHIYVSAQARDGGIESVKKNGPSLTIQSD